MEVNLGDKYLREKELKIKKPMRDFTPIGLKVRQFKKGKE